MTPEMEARGRRAIACRAWRWMAGSAYEHLEMACRVTDLSVRTLNRARMENVVPDFSDPATVGCLLALVREALKDLHISTRSCATIIDGVWSDGPWAVVTYSCHVSIEIATGETEVDALLAALEAAP